MPANPYQSPDEPKTPQEPCGTVLPREIKMRGSMPIRDVLHTQILVLSKRWIYAVLCLTLYIAFVLALGLLNPRESIFGTTFMLLGLVIMPAILPFTILMVYLRLLRDAKRQIGIFSNTETTLAPHGIQSTRAKEEISIPWSTFSSFLASERVALLFVKGSGNHLIISRKKLADERDWQVLIEFLHERFPLK